LPELVAVFGAIRCRHKNKLFSLRDSLPKVIPVPIYLTEPLSNGEMENVSFRK
jgi:hypothetical protein